MSKHDKHKPLVLVADNENDILALVTFKLEREGYEVVSADNGRSALELARELHPDVALLDLHMPSLDGYEVTREIRKQEDLADMPVMILSGSVREEDIKDSYEAGANDHFKKPFSPNVLVERVESLLEKKP